MTEYNAREGKKWLVGSGNPDQSYQVLGWNN